MNLINRALPLLNKFVPTALAIKGLSKIDNRLGSFIQNALASGYTTDNVLDFLRSSVQSPGDRQEMKSLQAMSQSGNIHPEQQRSLQNRESQESMGKLISGVAGLAGGIGGMDQQQMAPQQGAEAAEQIQAPRQQSQQQENVIAKYSDKLRAFLEEQIGKGRSPLEAGALAQLHDVFKKPISQMENDYKTNFSSILEATYGRGQSQQGQKSQGGNADTALLAALDKILKM